MDSKTLKVACLAAGLAAAWAAPQAANATAALNHFHYEMYIDPVYEMYNSYVVFNTNTSGYMDVYVPLGTLLTGQTTKTVEFDSAWEPYDYCVVGVYGNNHSGAVVSFGSDGYQGKSWNAIFGLPTDSTNETAVVNWCNSTIPQASPAPFNSFTSLWAPITPFTPTPSYNGFMFGFSDGVNAGDVQVMRLPSPAAVPEPSTFMGLVTAAISLLGFKRFRK